MECWLLPFIYLYFAYYVSRSQYLVHMWWLGSIVTWWCVTWVTVWYLLIKHVMSHVASEAEPDLLQDTWSLTIYSRESRPGLEQSMMSLWHHCPDWWVMRSRSSTAWSHSGYALHLLLVDILRQNILEGSRAQIRCGYLCTDQWNHTYANSS